MIYQIKVLLILSIILILLLIRYEFFLLIFKDFLILFFFFFCYRIYQVAKARIKLKRQRYKYRIRRRSSFYRPRKESEIREIPSINHRSSIINATEDYFSSTIPGASSSGVYSSSTTDFTTATTNTTFTSELSPNSLSPLAFVIGESTDESNHGSNAEHAPKRLSIHQFLSFQQRKQSDICEEFTVDNLDNDDSTKDDNLDDSAIIVTVPQNIVVYVDDYGSTVCSSCVLDDRNNSPNNDDYTEMDEEEGVISIDDNTIAFKTDQIETVEKSFENIQQKANGTILDSNHNDVKRHQIKDECITLVEISAYKKVCSKKSKKSNGKVKRLKFRNKITRYDNSESKQESKAAKTLTIITGK